MVESAIMKSTLMSILLKFVAVVISCNAGNVMATVNSTKIKEYVKYKKKYNATFNVAFLGEFNQNNSCLCLFCLKHLV